MNTRSRILIRVVFGYFFVLAFCANSAAYDEITVTNGATVRGTVKFDGNPPKLQPLQITKYKEVCHDAPNESLVLGSGKGIRYAVIALEGISKGKAVEKEVVHEIDNSRCRFAPHVVAASVGQFVLFKNSDPILHTAHAYFTANQPQFNIGLYPGRVSRKPLVAPGLAKIICEVHPWMTAYIVVTDHPYQAVTDAYGEYLINDVPPGNYRVKIWHEILGTQEKPVEVKAGAATLADFTLNQNSGVKK